MSKISNFELYHPLSSSFNSLRGGFFLDVLMVEGLKVSLERTVGKAWISSV